MAKQKNIRKYQVLLKYSSADGGSIKCHGYFNPLVVSKN